MYHLFKCEAKYLEQLNDRDWYTHKFVRLEKEEGKDYLIFEILPDLINKQFLTTIDVKNHFNSLINTVSGLVWITKPDNC